jgi:hypothetical protein
MLVVAMERRRRERLMAAPSKKRHRTFLPLDYAIKSGIYNPGSMRSSMLGGRKEMSGT